MVSASPSTFHGWKLGEMISVGDRVRLRSGTHGIVTDVEDTAMCFKHLDHDAPEVNCQCGFAANGRVEPLVLYSRPPFSQLLEVELSGRMVPGKPGPRAESQRILQVILNPVCYRCQGAATLVTSRPSAVAEADLAAVAPERLVTTCEECIADRYWRIGELAESFGLELLWAKPEHVLILLGRGRH